MYYSDVLHNLLEGADEHNRVIFINGEEAPSINILHIL